MHALPAAGYVVVSVRSYSHAIINLFYNLPQAETDGTHVGQAPAPPSPASRCDADPIQSTNLSGRPAGNLRQRRAWPWPDDICIIRGQIEHVRTGHGLCSQR